MNGLAHIETLYAGPIGDSHFQRVQTMTFPRAAFWRDLLAETGARSVLEVGCGIGVNAAHIAPRVEYTAIDISPTALALTRSYSTHLARSSASRLPFLDRSFDLVVSSGLLMHVPKDDLPTVMREQARVARQYVILCEYDDLNGTEREIDWHGVKGALWSRPIALWWWLRNPEFVPVWRRKLTKADGFDRTLGVLYRRGD